MHFAPGVALTEVQQDRAFAIMHAQAPQRRELDKQVRAAHDALRALSTGPFDETRASSQAQALGRAVAAQELLHARTQAQLMALLTPDQRAQARQGRPPAPAQP
jgi:Spy/CpxP family protein refolding chaperone